MKLAAILLSTLAFIVGDVTPRSGSFNPKRLAQVRSFPAPGLWLLAPGGKFIATMTGGDGVGLIDATTGRDLGVLGDHGGSVRHDGNWGQSDRILATTASNGSVKVWDAVTRKEIGSIKTPPHDGFT